MATPFEGASLGNPWKIQFNLGSITFDTSSDIQARQRLLNDLRQVAEAHKVDFDKIKEAIDSDKKEKKEDIEKSLKSVAELERQTGTKGRLFRVLYWDGNEVKKANGVQYPEERDKDGDVIGYPVLLDRFEHSLTSQYETMDDLREVFIDKGTPYRIVYFD